MPSLTRADAVARARILSVRHTALELDVTGDDTFAGNSRIEFTCSEPGASTFLDCRADEVARITLNGAEVPLSSWVDGRIALGNLAADNVVEVEGRFVYSHDAEGLHQHVDPADGERYLFAMSFLDAAPRWFACFDQPDLKSTFALSVTAPEGWTVIGNGASERMADGRWRIDVPTPISTYLVTLCAGPWVSVEGDADGTPLALYARRSLAPELARHAEDILAVTRAGFAEYRRLFRAAYPFGAYKQVFVPDFNAGAMENPGCVVLRDSMLYRGAATQAQLGDRAGVIIHELAHMWFGDLVTMRWWDDLWLNEAFAEYLSQRVTSAATGYERWTAFGVTRKPRGIAADQRPSSHPVAGNAAEDTEQALGNFDAISYTKGAALLRQLNARLGDEVLWAGLNAHIDAHAFANATMADLLGAWRDAGAADIDAWADAWLRTQGVDLLRADATEVERLSPRQHPARRDHSIAVVALDALGRESGRAELTVGSLARAHGLEGVAIVPDADDASWATVRPSVAWRELPVLSSIDSVATRSVLYNGLADAARHGELAARDALRVLARALPGESNDDLLAAGLAMMAELAAEWSGWDERDAATRSLADVARGLVLDADPGSDRQVIAWRALLGASDDADELRAWLHGAPVPAGCPFDAVERWKAVVRLASVSDASAEIAAELERDPSLVGQRGAAEAHASSTTPDGKPAALEAVVAGDAGPQELVGIGHALYRGLGRNDAVALAQQWCERLPELCRNRRGWALQLVLAASFPHTVVDAAIAECAEEASRDVALPQAARRELADAAEELRRAVDSVARFAALQ